ncbi:MAG: glycosyltransferase [bacterium]|nr:glycosyltransferase [bacterium]
MNYQKKFHHELIGELNTFLKAEAKKYPENDLLTIDLHCHDYNSKTPDELLGRILSVPETWLKSEDCISMLKNNGCDTFTMTNHNNAESCYELREKGIDVLTGAEFSCMVPDYKVGIHVLTYGFTPKQEKILYKLRNDIYKFQEFTAEQDIPTIWAHPLYHYSSKGVPPFEFFEKMALLFQRFEVLNGQRDTRQNMLVKLWIDSMTEETIENLAQKTGIPADRYCREPYKKTMSGGSDSHMGIFAGLAGTRLHVEDLAEKLKIIPRSQLALEAIKKGAMAPFGLHNNSEKMAISFLDYFCQIALNMKDPGLLRILLHKGTARDKLYGLLIANGFSEIKRHKVTMNFLELFHNCFTGTVPGFHKRLFVPKVYKPIFDEASNMAITRRDRPRETGEKFNSSIHTIYTRLNTILFERIVEKLERINNEKNLTNDDLASIFESLELPAEVRTYMNGNSPEKDKRFSDFNLSEFLDGLTFPFMASAIILSGTFASSKVMFNSRPLLEVFSDNIGKLKYPHRMLWLTDTFEDGNGVAFVLKSMLEEVQKHDLPIDFLVCSSTLQSADHLIVVPPLAEFTLPFYEQQPLRIPDLLAVHGLFQEGEYDRIICSTEGPMGLISLFLKQSYTVPAYFFVHTDWMMFAKQVLNFDQQNRSRLRRLLRAYYRGFDKLFVLNKDHRNWFTGRDMGFSESEISLTAHWAEDIFVPKTAKKEDLFGVTAKTKILLYTGRISDEKGVMELPYIYRKVKETHPHARMVFAGIGPKEKELKELMPDAIFMGWVDHEKVPEIYSAADMLLLPSKFDTFGCVVLEALSCGLPVTAYKTKGPRDIIIHEKNGYLVKNKNEMITVIKEYLANKTRQTSFKKAALTRAKAYDTGTIMAQFLRDVDLPGKYEKN